MSRKKNFEFTIDTACPHTIKKFELIEEYVKSWAQKLLNFKECNGIVFIDCMCNSGIYKDINGNTVYGTPIRISKLLSQTMQAYPQKQALLYFNDLSTDKVAALKTHLPPDTQNFHIYTSSIDGNELLRRFQAKPQLKFNYLLVYDPYTASIVWDALMPFLNIWGEVIINHMVSDTIRGVSQAKKPTAIEKYEKTYKANIDELIRFGSDRNAFEQKIREIILAQQINSNRKYHVSSFPFFNNKNVLVYNLIHCSGNIEGFKLFKKTAWKTFGGKSSLKNTHGSENQLMFDLTGSGELTTQTDEYCYHVKDIAKYLHDKFKGRKNVPFDEVYGVLETHPIFPSDGFRAEIKQELKSIYNVTISQKTMTFN